MDIPSKIKILEERVSALERILDAGSTSPASAKEKSLSIREFINSLKPSTNNDILLAIGYYFEIVKEAGFFTVENLRSGFNEAKIIAPKNISDVIAKNTKKGYIMIDSTNSMQIKAWVLTNTGEEYLETLKHPND